MYAIQTCVFHGLEQQRAARICKYLGEKKKASTMKHIALLAQSRCESDRGTVIGENVCYVSRVMRHWGERKHGKPSLPALARALSRALARALATALREK